MVLDSWRAASMVMGHNLVLVFFFFFFTFLLCSLYLIDYSSTEILSLTGFSPIFGKLALLFARTLTKRRKWSSSSQSLYNSFSFLPSQLPYYASDYPIDPNWTTPIFSYASNEYFNYSVVSVSSTPSSGHCIFFISEFSVDITSQTFLLTVLGSDKSFVYLNGRLIAFQQYPMYINQALSISKCEKFRLAAQVVSSGADKPFLYIKIVGQQDGKCYLHSTSSSTTWSWYFNDAIVPGMINISKAMSIRELYEVDATEVSVFNTSYSHDRWPTAQTQNFYELFSEEIQAVGPGRDKQPFGTYFVFAQFDVDSTGTYKVILQADDAAIVYLDSERFATLVKRDNQTTYTTKLMSGTHFLVAQVVNNGEGSLIVLPNGSGLDRTGFLCCVVKEKSRESPVLKSAEGYNWRILSYPSVLPRGSV